jgi:hypothetical protein
MFVGGCSAAPSEPNSRLMNSIEQKVTLPPDAAPMADYSRYYAQNAAGKIQGVYVIHSESFRDAVRQFCAEDNPGTFPCSDDGKPELAAAGARKWLTDTRDLPIPNGGGCGVIQFQYYPATDRISAAECNGDY